jgi:hypothetical protein
MKQFHIILLLLAILFLDSCIGEDTDSCFPDNNLRLEFLYTDQTGKDIFAGNIHGVDVFVFDRQGLLVSRQTADKASLSAFAGMEMGLPPGTYRIVCWGNASDRTLFSEVQPGSGFNGAFLAGPVLNGTVAAPGCDPLYYAPKPAEGTSGQSFTVTVPEQGIRTEAINFCSAHIKMEIYIRGFEDKPATGGNLFPLIELMDIPAGYNFGMEASGSTVSYRGIADSRNVDGQQLSAIDFYVPLFDENTPMRVLIKKQSDSSTLTVISLKDFIRDNHIQVTGIAQLVIPILVEYKQASVNITLPGWGKIPVGPEL